MTILKDYICVNPFNYMEIHKDKTYACCPSWLNTSVCDSNKLEDYDESVILQKIRESVLDGSYSYCDKKLCPYLSELVHNGIARDVIVKRDSFHRMQLKRRVSFCFDWSCNLSCPSCRNERFNESASSRNEIRNKIDHIQELFGREIGSMSISGTSDPLFSATYREFLENFDRSKFPKLRSIYLQTNGTLLDTSMWERLKPVQDLITTLAVSIDAATEKTYSIVRRGGNWESLQRNLAFIGSLPMEKSFSFVVQDTNYKEMLAFYEMINSICSDRRFTVYYAKISNWGTYTDEEFANKAVYLPDHPEFPEFLKELTKIAGKFGVTTNLNDTIDEYSLIKRRTRLL